MRLLLNCVFAIGLAAGAGSAATIFNVSIEDAAFSGPGAISLQLAYVGTPSEGVATVSGVVSGSSFGAVQFSQNATGSLPGDFTLTANSGNTAEIFQDVDSLILPLNFILELDATSAEPLTFSLQLFENDGSGDSLEFTIDWDGVSWIVGDLPAGVSISEIPEPSSIALMASGLALAFLVQWWRIRRRAV